MGRKQGKKGQRALGQHEYPPTKRKSVSLEDSDGRSIKKEKSKLSALCFIEDAFRIIALHDEVVLPRISEKHICSPLKLWHALLKHHSIFQRFYHTSSSVHDDKESYQDLLSSRVKDLAAVYQSYCDQNDIEYYEWVEVKLAYHVFVASQISKFFKVAYHKDYGFDLMIRNVHLFPRCSAEDNDVSLPSADSSKDESQSIIINEPGPALYFSLHNMVELLGETHPLTVRAWDAMYAEYTEDAPSLEVKNDVLVEILVGFIALSNDLCGECQNLVVSREVCVDFSLLGTGSNGRVWFKPSELLRGSTITSSCYSYGFYRIRVSDLHKTKELGRVGFSYRCNWFSSAQFPCLECDQQPQRIAWNPRGKDVVAMPKAEALENLLFGEEYKFSGYKINHRVYLSALDWITDMLLSQCTLPRSNALMIQWDKLILTVELFCYVSVVLFPIQCSKFPEKLMYVLKSLMKLGSVEIPPHELLEPVSLKRRLQNAQLLETEHLLLDTYIRFLLSECFDVNSTKSNIDPYFRHRHLFSDCVISETMMLFIESWESRLQLYHSPLLFTVLKSSFHQKSTVLEKAHREALLDAFNTCQQGTNLNRVPLMIFRILGCLPVQDELSLSMPREVRQLSITRRINECKQFLYCKDEICTRMNNAFDLGKEIQKVIRQPFKWMNSDIIANFGGKIFYLADRIRASSIEGEMLYDYVNYAITIKYKESFLDPLTTWIHCLQSHQEMGDTEKVDELILDESFLDYMWYFIAKKDVVVLNHVLNGLKASRTLHVDEIFLNMDNDPLPAWTVLWNLVSLELDDSITIGNSYGVISLEYLSKLIASATFQICELKSDYNQEDIYFLTHVVYGISNYGQQKPSTNLMQNSSTSIVLNMIMNTLHRFLDFDLALYKTEGLCEIHRKKCLRAKFFFFAFIELSIIG